MQSGSRRQPVALRRPRLGPVFPRCPLVGGAGRRACARYAAQAWKQSGLSDGEGVPYINTGGHRISCKGHPPTTARSVPDKTAAARAIHRFMPNPSVCTTQSWRRQSRSGGPEARYADPACRVCAVQRSVHTLGRWPSRCQPALVLAQLSAGVPAWPTVAHHSHTRIPAAVWFGSATRKGASLVFSGVTDRITSIRVRSLMLTVPM